MANERRKLLLMEKGKPNVPEGVLKKTIEPIYTIF